MNNQALNTLLAICMIGIVTVYAIGHGVDSNTVYLAIVAIAGLGGYEVYTSAKNKK